MFKYGTDSHNNTSISRLTRQKYWWNFASMKLGKNNKRPSDDGSMNVPVAYRGKKRDSRDFW